MNEPKFIEVETVYKGKQKVYKTKYIISIDQIALVEEYGENQIKIYLKETVDKDETSCIITKGNYKDLKDKMSQHQYIEVITSFEDKKITIAANQIASIEEYLDDTRIHLKATGNDSAQMINTKESYDDFTKRFEKACSRFCH